MSTIIRKQSTPFGQIVSIRSGNYGSLGTGGTTSNALGIGTLRLEPIYLYQAVTLTRIGLQVTTIGDVGSVVRLGIYGDTGDFYPGSLILDAGTIAGDSVATPEITISQLLPKGIYWIGGVVQNVTTTQPTVRTVSGPLYSAIDPGSTNVTNAGNSAQSMTGVTSTLPATFSATPTATNLIPRVFWKIA